MARLSVRAAAGECQVLPVITLGTTQWKLGRGGMGYCIKSTHIDIHINLGTFRFGGPVFPELQVGREVD